VGFEVVGVSNRTYALFLASHFLVRPAVGLAFALIGRCLSFGIQNCGGEVH